MAALLGWLAFVLIPACPASAQTPTDQTEVVAPADSVVASVTAIPTTEVPRHIEEDRQSLRNLETELAKEAADSTIVRQLEDMRGDLDTLSKAPAILEPHRATGRTVRDLEASCLRRKSKLDEWATTLEQATGALSERRENIQRGRERWSITRKMLEEEEDVTGRLLIGVDSLLAYTEIVGQKLDAQYTAMLDLRTDVSGQADRVNGFLERLTPASQPSFWDLLRPDSTPLWVEGPEVGGRAHEVRGAWTHAMAQLPGFVDSYLPNMIAHFFLFASLAAVLLVARRKRQLWEDEGDAEAGAPSSVDRPIAAALIGSLLLYRILYPLAPTVITLLVRAGSVVPVLRLVPRILPARFIPLSWVVVVLYFIDSTEFLFLVDPVLRRTHLLLVATLGLASALLFLRKGTGKGGPTERILRQWVGAAAALTFAMSFIANVYGAVELAGICTDAPLQILYFTIFAVVGARVLENLVEILLRIAPLRHLRSARVHRALLERRLGTGIRLAIAFFWVRGVLAIFDAERTIAELFLAIMNIGGTVGAMTITIGDFFAFFFTLWLSMQISRLLQFALSEDILPQVSLPRGVPQTITRLTHYAVVTLGFVLAVAATGFDLGKLAILAGGLGVGVGFGMQSIVNNFISGLILMFERPVQVGDTIEVGPYIGRVQNIGLRASTMRTYSGAEVVVPNANLVSNDVINWTLSDRRRRIELPVGVAYGSDPEQVRQLLLKAAADHVDALDTPAPLAFFLGFGDSALDFELRFWTNEFEEWQRVRGEVASQVQRALADAGIEIPFPQRTVHVRADARLPQPAPTAAPEAPPPPDGAG